MTSGDDSTATAPPLPQNPSRMNTRVPHTYRAVRGFTLIELLIAVVVLGIVVAVALPSFLDSIRKSRRSEAMSALSALQQAQERYRSNNPAYASAIATVNITSPTSPAGYYTLSIDSSTATSYVITANGTGSSQASDGQCAKLSVEVNGGAVKYASCSNCSTFTYNVSDKCWSR